MIYYTKEERDLIPIGSMIMDIEDGDFWYEGEWLGNDKYKCTKVVLDGIEYNSSEEDDAVGTIQYAKWFYIKLI